jgi:hypothetical protein
MIARVLVRESPYCETQARLKTTGAARKAFERASNTLPKVCVIGKCGATIKMRE